MGNILGIRREDKNQWERRVPLIPADLDILQRYSGLQFLVQSSPIRVFTDGDYRGKGLEVVEDLSAASIVLAVKEIPIGLLAPGRVYVYFSHVIKGQKYNMPMLRHLLQTGSTLIDYERITDDNQRRLIFFSLQAGQAGMIETLWAVGQRLRSRGMQTPLSAVRHAYEYDGLSTAKEHLAEIGREIEAEGMGAGPRPLVIGIAGYGNVAAGCREILDCLPVPEVAVADLPGAAAGGPGAPPMIRVTFREEHMAEPLAPGASFELQDYYRHPEKYRGSFETHLPHLDVLMSTIYWDERYPRLITREWTKRHYGQGAEARLQVIGDISCDIEGGVELTLKTTMPDEPCYVYDPRKDSVRTGVEGTGIVIMAVDNLPCELPREASTHFSGVLRDMVADLAAADWAADFDALELPGHLKRAVIVHRGQLTPDYAYLSRHLEG